LSNIVEKVNKAFSESFERLNCAGEVRLGRHDDYDQWGIEILVKFRDEEKLELLDGISNNSFIMYRASSVRWREICVYYALFNCTSRIIEITV
jgi:hypothetical protein